MVKKRPVIVWTEVYGEFSIWGDRFGSDYDTGAIGHEFAVLSSERIVNVESVDVFIDTP